MFHLLESFQESPEELLEKFKEPKDSDEFYLVGVAFEKLGKHPNAERMFRIALQKNFQHIPSLYGLAFSSFQSNHDRQAKNWLNRAIRLDPSAEKNVIRFQKELKTSIPMYQTACRYRFVCLQELEALKKNGVEAGFEIAKLFFEQSQFPMAIHYFRKLLKDPRYSRESAEYISFALENIYKGEELLERSLELAPEFQNRADLFFNLAMVCQHEQRRMDLALHFFYLATQEDPDDPGLRFSLEQASLDVIAESKRRQLPIDTLMFAHLYQGSVGVAKKYASDLKEFGSEILAQKLPNKLWTDWLSVDSGTVGTFLKRVFG